LNLQVSADNDNGSHFGGKSNFSRVASHKNNNVLKARRGVIKMLITIVLAFAMLQLPYHSRKMYINWYVCHIIYVKPQICFHEH
jgi:hypothetical protein